MSQVSSYPTRDFSETQKFLVLNPETQSLSLVLGRDLVEYITPQSTYVFAEPSRAVLQNEDYPVGSLIQTAGEQEAGDTLASVYLVVPAGEGDFPMANGNELLVIRGDDFLREQLASNTLGEGSDLVAHTGTSDTVTEALNKRTIYVGSVAELQALSNPTEGQEAMVSGSIFKYTGASWVATTPVSVKAFGAVGDGITDDSAAIQAAIDFHTHILIPDGEYLVDAESSRLVVPSERIIEFSAGATVKAIPTDNWNYAIFELVNVDNVTFLNPKLVGERYEHTGTGGEGGFGIRILSSSNVTVSGGWAKDFWADGLYAGAFDAINHTVCRNITIRDFESFGNRRQGASFTAVDGLLLENCIFRDTSGTAPESGVDIEPNGSFYCRNIHIENCKFKDNAGGGLELSNVSGGGVDRVDVYSSIMDNNSKSGIRCIGATNVRLVNCVSVNNPDRGVYAITSSTVTVTGGVFSDNSGIGIEATTGTIIDIDGVIVKNNGNTGVSIRDSGNIRNSLIEGNDRGCIIASNSTGVDIFNCHVKNNERTGIYAEGKVHIEGSTIKGNATSGNGRNIEIYADNCYMKNCVVRVGDNANKPEYGLRSTANSGLTVVDNDFRDSGAVGDIYIANLSGEVVEDNFPYKRYGPFSARPTENLEPGMTYYNTDTNLLLYYTFGGQWKDGAGNTYPA